VQAQYRHTQIGWVVIVALGAAASVIVPAFLAAQLTAGLAVFGAVLAVALLLFGTLTVRIDDRSLRLHFALGLIRKRIGLGDIRSYRAVRNKWYYGWGIRLFPGGILYNVSGLEAVEILLESGKRYRIGTDEPDALCRALENAIGAPEPLLEEEALAQERGSRRWAISLGVMLVVVACVVAGLFYLQARPPEVTVGPQSFTVDSLFYGDQFALSDVIAVSLEQRLPRILARTNGYAASGTLRGWFKLEGMGEGKLFVEHGTPPYVVVTLREGFVIINFEDSARTQALFVELMRARAGR
jgi:hypothetical protein